MGDEDKEEFGSDEIDEDSSQLTNSSDDEEEVNWISWFVSLKGNEFFCEIEEDYIQDDFNLTGLSVMVPFYDYALDMMLDIEIPTDKLTEDQLEIVETAAEALYGLIHARYILTVKGMNRMHEKFLSVDFGRCPRVNCQGQPVLPVGMSDMPRTYSVHVFCPKCRDIYYPKSARQANLDGAYFGTTFSHLFLMIHNERIPIAVNADYVPKIFGFKIHKSSPYWKLDTKAEAEAEAAVDTVNASRKQLNSPQAAPATLTNQLPAPPLGGDSQGAAGLPAPPFGLNM